MLPNNDYTILEVTPGLKAIEINFPEGPARGRAVLFNVDEFELKIYPFHSLINRSFHPNIGAYFPPEHNSGVNILQFLNQSSAESLYISPRDIDRCIFACNTLHTNFVRGNGFVMSNGELIHKPWGAVALDGEEYRPLGFYQDSPIGFQYESLILLPAPPRLHLLEIDSNTVKKQDRIRLCISGPAIVRSSKNVVDQIPFKLKEQGQTLGNEINYHPLKLKTSLTAFGVEKKSKNLIVASFFAGEPKKSDNIAVFSGNVDEGVTISQLADLMIMLGADEAILGGGAGDTQQYLYKQEIWVGQPRHQENRAQTRGIRGLGAIFAILK